MIVVFGGAFNPPTVAHREIYYHIRKHLNFDRFIYLPVSNLYTKRSLSSNYHRLQMLSLLTKDMPLAEVSTMEFDDSDYQGTYQSLLRFQEKYPGQEIAFVIGADNLFKLHKWINARSLLSEFRFIVLNRQTEDISKEIQHNEHLQSYMDHFILLPEFDMNVSSTIFRETFDPTYVTPEVYDYIMQHHLYRGEL